MDKFKITSFKDEIATAILNLQEKLNPNKDGYIDKTELPAVLDFFGVDDVQKLLKSSDNNSPSIFANNNEPTSDEDDETINGDQFTRLLDEKNAVLRNDGSAAYELHNNIASDLITASSGTPFAAQMKNLYDTKKLLQRQNKDITDIDNKIDALNEAVKEYIKSNQKDVNQALIDNDAVKRFNYGKDGSKTGYIIQSFDFKGSNTINQQDDEPDTNVDAEGSENADDESEQPSGNQAGVNVKYEIEVVTENLHAIGNIEAGSENSDIQGAVVYNKQLNNGSQLSFSGNFRQTIEKGNNITACGGSLDLIRDKMSAGAFASYEYHQIDENDDKTLTAEVYAKYGTSIRCAVGLSGSGSGGTIDNYKYGNIKLSGKRDLTGNNISLNGAIEGEYGVETFGDEGERTNMTTLKLNLKGGLAFKSKSFNTNFLGNVKINSMNNVLSEGYDTSVTATLLGSISTDKIDVTATITGINSPVFKNSGTGPNDRLYLTRETTYSSSITITPKKVFGKQVTPSITYNLSNDGNLQHYIGANLGINL